LVKTVKSIDGRRSRPQRWCQRSTGGLCRDGRRRPSGNRRLPIQAGWPSTAGHRRQRISGNQRAGDFRGGRRRPIPRSPDRGARPASSTGSWPSGRGRRRRETFSARREVFDDVPFFWSQHYDIPIKLCGPC
jgi:hypothetical protein